MKYYIITVNYEPEKVEPLIAVHTDKISAIDTAKRMYGLTRVYEVDSADIRVRPSLIYRHDPKIIETA